MPPGSSEDMTACFGAFECENDTQETVLLLPQLAASVYCDYMLGGRGGGGRGGVGEGSPIRQ